MTEKLKKNHIWVWICEDLDDKAQSGFARSKRQAEYVAASNRGYDFGGPKDVKDAIKEGWIKEAIRVQMHKLAYAALQEFAISDN